MAIADGIGISVGSASPYKIKLVEERKLGQVNHFDIAKRAARPTKINPNRPSE